MGSATCRCFAYGEKRGTRREYRGAGCRTTLAEPRPRGAKSRRRNQAMDRPPLLVRAPPLDGSTGLLLERTSGRKKDWWRRAPMRPVNRHNTAFGPAALRLAGRGARPVRTAKGPAAAGRHHTQQPARGRHYAVPPSWRHARRAHEPGRLGRSGPEDAEELSRLSPMPSLYRYNLIYYYLKIQSKTK